jgi:hypothetical protein
LALKLSIPICKQSGKEVVLLKEFIVNGPRKRRLLWSTPILTHKLSKKEDIILLEANTHSQAPYIEEIIPSKASIVNGFKYPLVATQMGALLDVSSLGRLVQRLSTTSANHD